MSLPNKQDEFSDQKWLNKIALTQKACFQIRTMSLRLRPLPRWRVTQAREFSHVVSLKRGRSEMTTEKSALCSRRTILITSGGKIPL